MVTNGTWASPSTPRRAKPRRARSATLTFLLIYVGITSIAPSRADYGSKVASLPFKVGQHSSFSDGTYMYVVGGANRRSIVRFDPATRLSTTMSATLPGSRANLSTAWTGRYAYIFGGDASTNYSTSVTSQIVRYDPAADATVVMPTRLPTARAGMGVAWDGTYVYLFGGYDYNNREVSEILRYHPATDTIETMGGRLSQSRWLASAVFDGTNFYVFGGRGFWNQYDRIDRYSPSTDTVTAMNSKLRLFDTSAVWDGHNALIFGGGAMATGYSYSYGYQYVYKYDTSKDSLSGMSYYLPSERQGTSAVWDGNKAWVLGGYYTVVEACGSYCYQWHDEYIDDVVQYTVLPAPPSEVRALPGTTPGSIQSVKLTWRPPAPNSYSAPITSYRIYRSYDLGGGGYEGTPFDEVPGNYFSYTDSTCSFTYVCYYRVSAVNAHGEGEQSEAVVLPGIRYNLP